MRKIWAGFRWRYQQYRTEASEGAGRFRTSRRVFRRARTHRIRDIRWERPGARRSRKNVPSGGGAWYRQSPVRLTESRETAPLQSMPEGIEGSPGKRARDYAFMQNDNVRRSGRSVTNHLLTLS